MNSDSTPIPPGTDPMHRRRITLPDGRYMIFYTFGDAPSTGSDAVESNAPESGEPMTGEPVTGEHVTGEPVTGEPAPRGMRDDDSAARAAGEAPSV